MKDVVADIRPFDDPVPPDAHDFDLITFLFFYHDTTYMNVLHILSWHAVPCDPGESEHRQFQTAMSAWPSPRINRLGTPNDPAIRFTREVNFGAT